MTASNSKPPRQRSASQAPRASWRLGFAVLLIASTVAVRAYAAQTPTPAEKTTTRIIVKVDTEETLNLKTKFQNSPPSITIEFPGRNVIGSLPERSSVQAGAIQAITTEYQHRAGASSSRFIRSLKIVLSGPYPYRVRSEPGNIIIEIDHPASIRSSTMEVGLKGGTILGGLRPMRPSERFRAMQSALEQALPAIGTRPIATTSPPLAERKVAEQPVTPPTLDVIAPTRSLIAPTPLIMLRSPVSRTSATQRPSPAVWFWIGLLIVTGAGSLWVFSQWEAINAGLRTRASSETGSRLPSGVALIDGLVWQAFERQGYQLVTSKEIIKPTGTLRIISKEGAKAVLLFVWNGVFFEKRTVEQFAGAMREAGVEQGFLVASGSFTVPAQRVAKDEHITLIGREQLMELLSVGATTEYFTKQLEQFHGRLEESKETLREYSQQLDTLRRQRNEASWHLGEERAKSAKLEAQVTEMDQQLRHHEAELKRWEQEAANLRKQWEESQWYLGESRERVRHLERQIEELQEFSKHVEPAERARDEANWYLGQEQTQRESLEARLGELQDELNASKAKEQLLQDALDVLKATLDAIRTHGERRQVIRRRVSEALVELRNGDGSDKPVATGTLRDVSSTGVGFEIDRELPTDHPIRLRMQVPGREQPIESTARIVWQRPGGEPSRFQSGAELVEISAQARSLLEQLLVHSPR